MALKKGTAKTGNDKTEASKAAAGATLEANMAPPTEETALRPANEGVDRTHRREETPEGLIQKEPVDQGEDEDEDGEITEHARKLKRLDGFR